MRFARLGPALVAPAALLSLSCSDPVPPTPRGAYSVSFSDTGVDCNIAQHNAAVGEVTDTERKVVVTNGLEDASVSCSVTGSGPFAVEGEIQLGGDFLQISIAQIKFPDATKDNPVKGQVGFQSIKTQGVFSSSECDFWFFDSGSNGQGVAAGKAWVSFRCAAVKDDMNTCGIANGFVILENCSGAAEEE